MIQIQRFVVNMIEENCYVLSDETHEALIIDCGAYFPEEQQSIARYITEKNLKVVRLINTHSHFDHILGDSFLYDTYGVKPEMHRLEQENYEQVNTQIRTFLHGNFSVTLPPIGPFFEENDVLEFGHHRLRVIFTPGHTIGGVCFYMEDEGVLFSGDSLFPHSIGRTDFPKGNAQLLIESLKSKVLCLPSDVTVCPGHGGTTTIGAEREGNPYLQE